MELPYADPEALERRAAGAGQAARHLRRGRADTAGPPPRPTLADAGSERGAARPGRSSNDRGLGLDAAGWRAVRGKGSPRSSAGAAIAATSRRSTTRRHLRRGALGDRAGPRGLGHRPVPGHRAPAPGRRRPRRRRSATWAARINHVHLKDARRSVMAGIVADGAPATAIWDREAFCALGQGDLDVDGVIDGARRIGYAGWLVVEQDTSAPDEGAVRPRADGPAGQPPVPGAVRDCEHGVFRFGLIGAGRMGRTHLRALAGSKTVQVTAVVEPVRRHGAAMADAGRAVFEDVAAAARRRRHRRRADRRSHDSPHRARDAGGRGRRADPVREAMRPVERRIREAREAVDAQRRAIPGRLLAALRSGAPGAAAAHRTRRARRAPSARQLPVGQASRRAQRSGPHSGGIFRDMGVHEFDQVRWLSGQDIRPGRVPASAAPAAPTGPATWTAPRRSRGCRAARRVRVAGPVLPGGRHGPGRGVRHARRVRCDFLDPKDGERAQLEALRPAGRGLRGVRAGGPATAHRSTTRWRRWRRPSGRRARDQAPRGDRPVAPQAPELRIGIVGYGMMGKRAQLRLPRRARRSPACRCARRHADLAAATRRRSRAAARAYGVRGLDDRLARRSSRAPDVDIVDICTPPGTHAEIVEAAAAAGQGGAVREAARGRPTREAPGALAAVTGARASATRSASTTGGCPPSR